MKPSLLDPSPVALLIALCILWFAPLPWPIVGAGMLIVEGLLGLLWFYRNRKPQMTASELAERIRCGEEWTLKENKIHERGDSA